MDFIRNLITGTVKFYILSLLVVAGVSFYFGMTCMAEHFRNNYPCVLETMDIESRIEKGVSNANK